jgi:hypothetical protein
MRPLDQIAADPQPKDQFERLGQVFEVIEVLDGQVLYRVERARLKKPAMMTADSWRSLALDKHSEAV